MKIHSALAGRLSLLTWVSGYSQQHFRDDLLAGIIVSFITIPQSIAYAFLGGLPAEAGLYAAVAALICYGLFGPSRTLAVGPMAIIAMMCLTALSRVAEPGTPEFSEAAHGLAFLVGCILLLLRILNFGAIISFLSHAVVTGFVSASACLIIISQVPSVLGLQRHGGGGAVAVWSMVTEGVQRISLLSVAITVAAVVILWLCRGRLESLLRARGLSEQWISVLVRSAPMYVVVLGGVFVWMLAPGTREEISVVGALATAPPTFEAPWIAALHVSGLLPSALLIALVTFIASTSVGAAVASRRRERIEPNRELIGLGVANIGAALAGGFPVAGSFARTIVNFTSGAVSPMSSIVTALSVVIAVFWFSPLFLYLPEAVLSAIILVSAAQLIDIGEIRRMLIFNRIDAMTFACTFVAVLVTGVEIGLLIGIVVSFALMISASSRPNLEIVGRIGDSGHFRSRNRYDAHTAPSVLAVRLDESLYFVNARYVETFLLDQVAEHSELRHIVLICSAVNFIDTSGLEVLERLSANLEDAGVTLHLAEVKGPVMGHLNDTQLVHSMKGEIFFTTDVAMRKLAGI